MIAPDWEFNGLVQSPSGYDSSRSFSSLETDDVKAMDLEFMRFKEDEEEESDDINVHGHAKLDLGLSRSDSNVCEEAGSTFKADHGFRRILMTSFTTDSDVNDDQVGEITEQENAPAARANKGKRTVVSSKNGPRVCADCERTTTPLWRSGPQGPKSLCNACGIRYNKKKRAMIAAAAAATESLSYKKRSTNSWKTGLAGLKKNFKSTTKNCLDTASDRQFQFSAFYKNHGPGKELSRLPLLRSFGELEEAAASLMAIKFGHCHE